MTPRTRTSNKDTDFKVYYSKKVPQQVYFPHKRKTVRRPDPAEQDGVDKRQMKFLPEKMSRQTSNYEEESEEDEVEGCSATEDRSQEVANAKMLENTPGSGRKGTKRRSNIVQEYSGDDEGPVKVPSKRRRRSAIPKTRQPSTKFKAESDEEHDIMNDGKTKGEPSRTLRRQSTMTQLADGRRPSQGAIEPDFKPIKRRSRVSWRGTGTDKEKDRRQRTLTQMIPGMARLSKEELDELSDLDADEGNGQTNNHTVSQSLIEQGLLEITAASHDPFVQSSTVAELQTSKGLEGDNHDHPIMQPSAIVQSVEHVSEDDSEKEYQPTQFIEAPTRKTRQTPRRAATRQPLRKAEESGKSAKSRFSLLSTPEKRRIFEIPSSQSPAESVLSTQVSPQKSKWSALQEHNVTIITETPSKRRQITFQEPTVQPAPPARLRKFESTIQDSEDEELSDIETTPPPRLRKFQSTIQESEDEGGSEFEDDPVEQQQTDSVHQHVHGRAVGADTQAVLGQIDQACADANEDPAFDSQGASEEPEPVIRQGAYEPSPELGESWAPVIFDDDGPDYESYRSARSAAKSQSFRDADYSAKNLLPSQDRLNASLEVATINELDLSPPAENVPSTPPVVQSQPDEDLPSTPMVIRDDSSDNEEAEAQPTPPRTVERVVPQPLSVAIHQSADLDGEPVQVPRSPSADRQTQQSHSSKAEQQLQSEWLSYSQYIHAKGTNSSSMYAAADASSYSATPQLPRTGELAASSAHIHCSQATTVDEATPKKNRTQRVISANTTPHRISKSQPFVSPDKPPSLFIPSSFPSPSRAGMEGWSSPTMGRTQNLYGSSQVLGSSENFSIPLPPPVEDDIQ